MTAWVCVAQSWIETMYAKLYLTMLMSNEVLLHSYITMCFIGIIIIVTDFPSHITLSNYNKSIVCQWKSLSKVRLAGPFFSPIKQFGGLVRSPTMHGGVISPSCTSVLEVSELATRWSCVCWTTWPSKLLCWSVMLYWIARQWQKSGRLRSPHISHI